MDKEQEEFQSIGFFGIWRESFKIIHQWSQIFLRLGLTLTLPLSFFYLAQIYVYITIWLPSSRDSIWFKLIQIAFIIFLFVFTLLSTSAVVYTIACVYSSKNVTLKDVMRVVPKVCKRLMVTFLCVMPIMLVYNLVFSALLTSMFVAYVFERKVKFLLIGTTLLVLYLIGVCYMGVIWQLAYTISVLEESYGFQALSKSKMLAKGKMGISFVILLVNNLCFFGVVLLYNSFVVNDELHVGMFKRVGFGIICLLLLCIVILVGLVVHAILYLVCKSYHHEPIEVCHAEGFVLLMPKNVQLVEPSLV